jgi:hypothetical protein
MKIRICKTRGRHRCTPVARALALALALLGAAAPGYAATFNWASGNFVPGTTAPGVLPLADVLNITAGTNKAFDAVSFTNNGTVNWASGSLGTPNTLVLANAAALTNNGLWVATSTGTPGGGNLLPAMYSNDGSAVSFTNTGVLRHTGPGQVTIRVPNFVNSGQIDAVTGVLNIDSLATTTAATFNAGTSFTGAGIVRVGTTSGFAGPESYRFNGAFSSTNLLLDTVNANGQASYVGSGAVLNGTMAWRGGRLSGTWAVPAGSTLTVGGGGAMAASMTIDGTVVVNGGFSGGGGGVVTNRGSFILNGVSAEPASALINSGLVVQPAGFSGATLRSASLTNSGRIENNGGLFTILVSTGASTFNAGTTFGGSGAIQLELGLGGTSTFNGAFSAVDLTLNGSNSSVVGNGAVQSGLVKWTANNNTALNFSGTWRVAADGELALTGGGANTLRRLTDPTTVLTVDGKMTLDAPAGLSIEGNARLVNNGTVDLKVDQGIVLSGSGTGNGGTFTNNGLLVKTGGTGTSTLGGATALTVVNNGIIDVHTGTLRLRDNFSNAGTLTGNATLQVVGTLTNNGTLAPGSFGAGTLNLQGSLVQTAASKLAIDLTTLSAFDLLNISGSATLGGTLALNCLGACSFAAGDSFTILDAAGSLSGSFASITLSGFGSGAFSVLYDAPTASVRLLVTAAVSPVPEPQTWALLLGGLGVVAWRRKRRAGSALNC